MIRRGRPLLTALATCGLVVATCLIGPSLASAGGHQDQDDSVGSARDRLARWVETRRIISQEKRDWTLGREVLASQVELAQNEVDTLRERNAEAAERLKEADHRRADLIVEKEGLEAAAADLRETIVRLEQRTKALLARSPEPIRERVRPLSQQLPGDQGETKLSLSQRFQNVVGILNAVNKFNGEITVTNERLDLPGGTAAEVTAFYLGLGQAYYASANGAAGGVGTAGPDGFQWVPNDAAAPQIAKAIAILRDGKTPEFVSLPIRVD